MAKKPRVFSKRTLQATTLLGLQIRQARIERAWTHAELAGRAGITLPTLAKIERGEPTVGLGLALEVASIVGVPIFFDDPRRLAREVANRAEVVRLLPGRVRDDREDVDDDF